jgi:hypothetical protein
VPLVGASLGVLVQRLPELGDVLDAVEVHAAADVDGRPAAVDAGEDFDVASRPARV